MAAAETEPQAGAEPDAAHHWGGILLDIAGVVAGIVLILIVVDIWADGRITGRLASRRQPQPQQEGADGAGPAD